MPLMYIYFLTIILGVFATAMPQRKKKKAKKNYCMIMGMMFIIASAFRGVYALSDTRAYHYIYIMAENTSFSQYIRENINDAGFYIFNWLFSNIGISWQVFVSVISVFCFGTLSYWIYKMSSDVMLSFLLFEGMFLFTWICALRTSIAMSFLMIAHIYWGKNNKRAIFFLIVSIFFHGTAIIAILYPLFKKIRLTSQSIMGLSIAVILFFISRSAILDLINGVAGMIGRRTYSRYMEYPMALLVCMLIVLLVVILFRKNLLKDQGENNLYIVSHFMAVAMLALGGGVVLRLCWIFAIPSICILLPKMEKYVHPRIFYRTAIVCAASFLFIHGFQYVDYYFFWQTAVENAMSVTQL